MRPEGEKSQLFEDLGVERLVDRGKRICESREVGKELELQELIIRPVC